jgi:hypothetical protein
MRERRQQPQTPMIVVWGRRVKGQTARRGSTSTTVGPVLKQRQRATNDNRWLQALGKVVGVAEETTSRIKRGHMVFVERWGSKFGTPSL